MSMLENSGGAWEKHDTTAKWCRYCRQRRPIAGFKKVFTKNPRRLVGYKCGPCHAAGKLSQAERDRREAARRIEREQESASRSALLQKEALERQLQQLRNKEGIHG